MVVDVTANGCMGIGIFFICIGLEITVLNVGLPIAVAYNFQSKMTCLGIYLTVSALAGRFFASIEIDLWLTTISQEASLRQCCA